LASQHSVRGWIDAVDGAGTSWTAGTPKADWAVRQLVNHVVGKGRWTRHLAEGLTVADGLMR
jgi:hypothetical protein